MSDYALDGESYWQGRQDGAERVKGTLLKPKRLHVYIPDAVEDAVVHHQRIRVVPVHEQKQKIFRELVEQEMAHETLHNVCFQEGSNSQDVIDYFQTESRKLTKDDMMLVYFHGGAGYNSVSYRWEFAGYPREFVDAYRVIDVFAACDIDCLLIIDGFIPTRIKDKWQTRDPVSSSEARDSHHGSAAGAFSDATQRASSNVPGMFEIIGRGQQMQRPNGSEILDLSSDFTVVMVDSMHGFVDRINKPTTYGHDKKGRPIKVQGYAGWKAPHSIPQLLSSRKELNANPHRVWFGRTQRGDTRYLHRFTMVPREIRATGKITFYPLQIQGDVDPAQRLYSDDEPEDEGYEEGEPDDKSDDGSDDESDDESDHESGNQDQ